MISLSSAGRSYIVIASFLACLLASGSSLAANAATAFGNTGIGITTSPAYNKALDACQSNTDLNDTCDCQAFAFEMASKGTAGEVATQAFNDNTKDKDAFDRAVNINIALGKYGFCSGKIQLLTDLQKTYAAIAAGLSAPVFIATNAFLDQVISTLLTVACDAFLGTIQNALSGICIPSLPFNLPSWQFPTFPSGSCNGTPVFAVTGGLVPPPPASFGSTEIKYDGVMPDLQ
jgi:hypothetical protein